jgi:hypothetical protein
MNMFNTPMSVELQPFVKKLEQSHYDVIISLCEVTRKQAKKLEDLEVHQITSQYITLCNRLIDEIEDYIRLKKDSFIPYVNSLFEKDKDGHDCAKCTGNSCAMQHTAQLNELKESHVVIKDILYRLQMVALPLYSETIYPDVYRVLRNQMALLENNLTELFMLEETYLIPKVIEIQKNIHAVG